MATKVHRCQRCSKRLRRRTYLDSMAMLKDGSIDHLVCPDCLTLAEYTEMTVRAATTDVGITPDGRILTRAKASPVQEETRNCPPMPTGAGW
jgi:hypothetical protein